MVPKRSGIYERALRKGENFLAVILDATVRGGLGGVETIERLRNIDPDVNAIICSGYSDEAALSQFLSYGFRGALAETVYPARTGGCPAKGRQEHGADPDSSLGSLAFRNLLQLSDKSARTARHITEHSRPFSRRHSRAQLSGNLRFQISAPELRFAA